MWHTSSQRPSRQGLLNLTLNPLFHSDPSLAGGCGIIDDFGGQRALFLRNDYPATVHTASPAKPRLRVLPDVDFAPDLGARIGSLTWYRGAATCIGLCALTWLLSPGFENPIYGYVPPAIDGANWEAAKAQAIAPLGKGGTTGYRMAATSLVAPLADTPERPIINVSTKLASGDDLMGVLKRAGVGGGDAGQVVSLIGKALELGQIQSNTPVEMTLGRRIDKSQPRPLERLEFRANFGLKLEVGRNGNELALKQIPIAIDHTPLRIQGEVGASLYRSARAAGAPAKAVESYIKSLATRMPISRVGSDCKFDIIVEQQRAATGEVQLGNLMYAGLNQCGAKVQLLSWQTDGHTEWLDGSGRGQRVGMMTMPVNGHITSGYGMRFHPLLGFTRMHKGIDIGAPWGSPIFAATDGVVQFAGRNSGYGNFVKLSHAAGLATGYGHMSRIAVRPGQRVSKGQVIGYVGSTGLSTGPHVHYELYKNGVAINPNSMSFTVVHQLQGGDLSEFRARLSRLLAVPVGGGPRDDEDESE